MTVEEYKAEKNRQAQIKKVKTEIAEIEKELARKKAYLRKIENNN